MFHDLRQYIPLEVDGDVFNVGLWLARFLGEHKCADISIEYTQLGRQPQLSVCYDSYRSTGLASSVQSAWVVQLCRTCTYHDGIVLCPFLMHKHGCQGGG